MDRIRTLAILVFVMGMADAESPFDKYIARFEKDFDTKVTTLIRFDAPAERRDEYAGWCEMEMSPKEIVINQEYWDKAGPLMREEIIYHELGHCELLLEHNDAPYSEMNSRLMPPKYYKKYRDYYINEMKQTRRDR